VITQKDFYSLHSKIPHNKSNHYDYDEDKHHKYTKISSGSPGTLKLRLQITIKILSGSSCLNMIVC
jgi:hypothetical protein